MKKRYLSLILVLFTLNVVAQNDVVNDAEADGFNLNKPERETWLKNTGAGLFIHFNIDVQLGIVISHSLVGASDDYVNRYFSQLPQTFDPAKFDPFYIATLAKLAGMKYVVFTTKHHSGFCMWDTKTTDFDITHTPYKKDLLKEFVDATRRAGLAVGFYYSPEDFYFLHSHNLPVSRDAIKMSAAIRKEYDDYTRRQCEELMTKYGKIDVLFIDGEPKDIVKTTCWKLQPDLLITRGAIKTPEQTLPGAKITQPWLSPITMGTAWQYQPTNERYKSGNQLIKLLIEARAKGGSLLLNVGPKADGELAEEQDARLREMAAWYFINNEAIDSVRPWVVNNEKDVWFTSKNGHTVYALVTNAVEWKEGERKSFLFRSIRSTPRTKVSVLGQNSRILEYKPDADVSCQFKSTGVGLEVSVVKAQRIYDDHRWPNPVVIKIENVDPAIEDAVVVETGNAIISSSGVLLSGKVHNFKDKAVKRARFIYRTYEGQIETLYAEEWQETAWVNITADGGFKLLVKDLENKSYEYKAVADQRSLEIEGDNKVFNNNAK